MTFTASIRAHVCTVTASASKKSEKRQAKRRSGVARAQKQPKADEPAVVFDAPALANGSVSVAEKAETKVPSPAVNVIPGSRWVTSWMSIFASS